MAGRDRVAKVRETIVLGARADRHQIIGIERCLAWHRIEPRKLGHRSALERELEHALHLVEALAPRRCIGQIDPEGT